MMDRALRILAAAAAIVAAAAIGVVSAAFAIYAGVSPWVGSAWAAAIVTGVMALIVLIGAMAFRSQDGRSRHEPPPDGSLVEKVVDLVREHPVIAVGAAIGAGVYAIRNPQLVAAVFTAFMAGRRDKD